MELSKENQEWLLDISKSVYELAGVKVISINQHDLEIKLLQDQQKIEELEKENSELKIEKAKLFLRLGDMAEDNKQ